MRLYFGSYLSLPSFARRMPSSISGTNLAGSLTNFFMDVPPSVDGSVGFLARRRNADRGADIVHHRRDRDDAGIGRADAALARELLAPAFRDEALGELDCLIRYLRSLLQHEARIGVRLAGLLVDDVA